MFRFFVVVIVLLLNVHLSVQAFNIVYPKTENVTINSDKTFFIGNEIPGINLKINNDVVKIHHAGGFKHTVYLNYGVNKFTISNGKDKKVYTITRPVKTNTVTKEKNIISYNKPIVVRTVNDSCPLRSTPVDKGLNRLQHLGKDIELNAVGEYDNFYKIKLSRDDIAWISKSDTEKTSCSCVSDARIEENHYKRVSDADIFTLKLNNKVPYVLSENGLSSYTLTLYNMNEDFYHFGRFELQIAQDGKNFGYSSYYNDNNELIIRIGKYHNSLKGLRVTIDAGHGGGEFGAIGCLGDKEKDINLAISKKLKTKLKNAGAVVFMTREDDRALGLKERVDISRKNESQVFISIHNNALPDSLADRDASGTEVYYFYPQSRYLAKVMVKTLSKELGIKDRGSKGESFAVIRNSDSLAILIEVAFMINPEENYKLSLPEFQDKIADAIVKGLEYYFKGIDMEIVKGK